MFLAIVLAWLLPVRSLAQSATPTVSCSLTLGDAYVPWNWATVHLVLANPTDAPIRGYVQILSGRDNAIRIRQDVTVSARSTLAASSAVLPGSSQRTKLPPGEIAPVVWFNADGKELARTVLSGTRTETSYAGQHASTSLPVRLALTVGAPAAGGDSEASPSAFSFARLLDAAGDRAVVDAQVSDASALPRTTLGYQHIQSVLLYTPPDDLDAAQRTALLDSVRSGGTLVVCGTGELADSWLAHWLPVELIGTRQLDAIGTADGKRIPLTRLTDSAEAVIAKGLNPASLGPTLQDQNYVYAAVRRVGFGRIVFFSVSPAALNLGDANLRPLLHPLFASSVSKAELDPQSAAADRANAMSMLLGRSVVKWSLAAAVSVAYLLVVLVAQLSIGGSRRPVSFLITCVVAVILAGGLLVAARAKSGGQQLDGARLRRITFADDGTAAVQEDVALIGNSQQAPTLSVPDAAAVAEPIDFDPQDPPTLTPSPFRATDASLHADSFRRIWRASTSVNDVPSFVHAQFAEDGLHLQADNGLAAGVADPLLIWSASSFPLSDLPTGSSRQNVTAATMNPAGVYTHGSGIISQTDRLHGQLIAQSPVAAHLTPAESEQQHPAVVGWLNAIGTTGVASAPPSAAARSAHTLIQVQADQPLAMHGQTLVQLPLLLTTSPIGSLVQCDGPFNQLQRYRDSAMLPLDATGTGDGTDGGEWLVAVVPPAEIGTIMPLHGELSVELDSPRYLFTVQAHQFGRPVSGGSFNSDESAPVLASWNHAIGQRSIVFDVQKQDISPEGTLVLRLVLAKPDDVGAGPVPWRMRNLRVSLRGRVTGPPAGPS